MAENTRSKSTKRQNQKTQFENHSNLSDEEMVAETYKANEKASPSTQATKKLKKTEDFSSPSSPNNNDNNMNIDDKNEMEQPISSEPDARSRDTSSSSSQAPIITSQDAMDTDLPDNNSNKGITQGSADTQITSDTNNDVNSHNLEIFKEYNSRSDSQYILFFTRDQFDKEKSNNEIINDLKNAFLMENDIIEYKTNKKATIEFYTILI
ncbi:22453_t:CDS:1, partial [Rhizophagus irregularis]